MNQSQRHAELKEYVKDHLEADGWNVKLEHYFYAEDRENVITDVRARKDGQVVAVEVGEVDDDRLPLLRTYADDVVHIPYAEGGGKTTLTVDGAVGAVFREVATYGEYTQEMSCAVVKYLRDQPDDVVDQALDDHGFEDVDELLGVATGDSVTLMTQQVADERLSSL